MNCKKLMLLFFCMISSISLTSCSNHTLSEAKGLVAKAQYPNGVAFDDYDGKKEIRNDNVVSPDYMEAVKKFTLDSTYELFNTPSREKNALYSPLSLYMALALSASSADNETRTELLKAMHVDQLGIKELEIQTGNLFRLLYTDNKIGKLWLANSLWLDEGIQFKKDYLDTAAKNFYASAYSVDFSKEETGKLMSKWISENSRGTLHVSNPANEQQIMSIINTIYLYDEWVDKFNKNKTKKDTFYCYDDKEVTCDFMNMKYGSHRFIDGDGYTCSSLNFKNLGAMNFYLPDEGIDVYELISNPDSIAALLDDDPIDNVKNGEVIFKVPKFDFGTSLNLKDSLKAMGITNAFEPDADFTNLTEDSIAYISNIMQSTHISIDENGCEASAFTKIDYAGCAQPVDKAEMILDRPFLFTITSSNGVILFIGIVNNPML